MNIQLGGFFMRNVLLLLTMLFVVGQASALSDDELKKLKKGMRINEVKTVIGAPDNIQADSQSACEVKGAMSSITWSYTSKKPGDKSYIVLFCDGKFEVATPK